MKVQLLVPDVNVLLNAVNRQSSHHPQAAAWLNRIANGNEELGVPEIVLSGFVRISTNSQMVSDAMTPSAAFNSCDVFRGMPAYRMLAPTPGHWARFRRTAIESGISGRHMADAYLAAFALENDATFVTFDRGFARFPGLRVFEPARPSH